MRGDVQRDLGSLEHRILQRRGYERVQLGDVGVQVVEVPLQSRGIRGDTRQLDLEQHACERRLDLVRQRVRHVLVRADQSVDARSHAPEGCGERIHRRAVRDDRVEAPVAVAEPDGRAFERAQVARHRPQPHHDHERDRGIEHEGQDPVGQTSLRLILEPEREYAVVLLDPLQHPRSPVGAVHEDGFAVRETADRGSSSHVLRLEQLEVEPRVTRRIRNQIRTLFARHCLQLSIEKLQHVCLRQLAAARRRMTATGAPDPS